MTSSYPPPLRRLVYTLFITLTAAMVAGRILSAARLYEPFLSREDTGRSAAAILLPLGGSQPLEIADLTGVGRRTWGDLDPNETRGPWPATRPAPMPTFGSNDRSRWDTVRALVDQGTYVIGHRDGVESQGTVKYRDRGIITEDGWMTIDKVLNPDTQDFYSSKPPFLPTLVAGEYWLLKKGLGWSVTTNSWEVVRTILLTINWLPLVIYLALLARLIERYGRTDWGRLYVMAAGCFGTFLIPFSISLNNHSLAACTALFALYPALKIIAGSAEGRGTALDFVVAGFFGACTACNELPAASFGVALFLLLLWKAPGRTLVWFVPAALVPIGFFLFTNYLAIGRLMPAYSEFGGPWYNYEGSFWKGPPNEVKPGIDYARLKESKGEYAFHLLLGHHGLFSLTPMFLLAVAGMGLTLANRGGGKTTDSGQGEVVLPRILGLLSLALTVVVVGFYVVKTDNYGGWTTGPRWLMWLTPFLLLTMLPMADRLAGRRWGRGLGYVLLAWSVMSVSYPAWNPWRHPWLYNFLDTHGWIKY